MYHQDLPDFVPPGSLLSLPIIAPRSTKYRLCGESLEWPKEHDAEGKVTKWSVRPATMQEIELVKLLWSAEHSNLALGRELMKLRQEQSADASRD